MVYLYSLQDGPSIFAGFGGFKTPSDDSTEKPSGGAFDFLTKSTNGSSSNSTSSPAASGFNFASPAQSNTGFAFGTPTAKKTESTVSLGMVSHNMSLITILGTSILGKNFIKNLTFSMKKIQQPLILVHIWYQIAYFEAKLLQK